ncbi:unnamed protein product [Prunus armeniaca]
MVNLFKEDVEASLCLQSWLLTPGSKMAGIYDSILLSKQSVNRDENMLAAALYFWNSASNTFIFCVGPMAPALLDMAQIFGFRPHGRHVDAVEVPKCSIEEYMMFFRRCTNRLLEKEPEDEEVRIDFRKKFLSVMLLRDLPFGGEAAIEVPLGEIQMIWTCTRIADSSSATKVLFDGWDSWTVHAGAEVKKFMMQTIKDINAQVIEVTFVISAGDLELPFGDEEDQHETQVEQPTIEVTLSARRNKRKETVQPETSVESPPPPPTRSKRLRKRAVAESEEIEEPAVVPTETSGTDEELREASEAVGQEKKIDVSTRDKRKGKEVEEEEAQRIGPTSSELAIFDVVEAEHSAAVLEPEVEANHSIDVPVPEVEEERTVGTLAVVTSPFKPPIVVIPIHSVPGSSTTTSFANPELAEFEDMDLDAQLDKLEKLNSSPCKAKSKAVAEAVDRKAELDVLVANYNETKFTADKLEKHIEELQKQLARLRERQKKLGAGLGTKTKATFLVQNMISASRPALEIAEASIH